MDCKKVGNLIFSLRKEKGFTQLQLATLLNISDKTISKWERGLGVPDVNLLSELSNVLHVDIEKILGGDLEENSKDGGNMKRTNFYVCETCGNIITSTSSATISCCGRKLEAKKAKSSDEMHNIHFDEIENEYFVTSNHPMKKDHFISFIAYVSLDKVLISRLYPEQSIEMRFPKLHGGNFYFYCSKDGLFKA